MNESFIAFYTLVLSTIFICDQRSLLKTPAPYAIMLATLFLSAPIIMFFLFLQLPLYCGFINLHDRGNNITLSDCWTEIQNSLQQEWIDPPMAVINILNWPWSYIESTHNPIFGFMLSCICIMVLRLIVGKVLKVLKISK